ncbi:MAG: PPC domain-containing DNA-binding protein [Methanosarcinaceae archaeon]
MEYTKGTIGRVFVARVDHGDDLLIELEKLAKIENIESAMFVLIGAVRKAKLVTGPKESSIPPDIMWTEYNDVHEIVGVGNIFPENGNPKIHLHTAVGRGESAKVGCMRGDSETFMVLEVFILEISGILASRVFDSTMGFAPVQFKDREKPR